MSEASANPEHGKATLARGASIGRYVVLGLVGRGGMGEVYAAYDPELDRKVAVKLLRVKPGAGVSLVEGRQRTLREAQAIARLSHPNVVVVFDVGTFEEKVFIAMEFLDGHTAGFWTQSQPRTWQETLKVYQAAGRGLVAAHDKGLVHRDFKPDNIMVSRDGQVRVMDFGLARQADKAVPGAGALKEVVASDGVTTTQRLPAPLAEPAKAPIVPLDSKTLVLTPVANDAGVTNDQEGSYSKLDTRLTRTGAMMGTPAYMAPEQFRGLATDARTDQFSFCIALYEALYDERPFAGNTLMALTTNVVNGRVREAPANTKVPLWVRKILLRGLRVNADERYPSMAELLEALGKNPAVARKQAAIGVTAGLVAVGLLVFGLRPGLADPRAVCAGGPEKLAGIWELTPAGAAESPRQARLHQAFLASGKSYAKDVWATTSRALTNYARAWTDMYRENCEATAVRKEQSEDVRELRAECLQERLGGLHALTDVFSEATGEVVENAVSASNALGSLDRCADVPTLKAVVRPPEDAETRVKVQALRNRLAQLKAKFDSGGYRESLKKGPALVDAARVLAYDPLTAEALALLGTMYYKANEPPAAETALIEAFRTADSARHDEVRAEVAVDLVYVVGYLEGRFDEGYNWAKSAEAILKRIGGHDLLRAWLVNDLGCVHDLKGNKEEAVRAQQEALVLKRKALGENHPDIGVSEANLAMSLEGLGRNQEALVHVDRSIALIERGLGAGHPDVAISLNNKGDILNALGRYADARQAFEEAGRIWQREMGAENPVLGYALTGIGESYVLEGKPSMGLEPLERALKMRDDSDLSRKAETMFALARALGESQPDRARARDLAERARTSYARTANQAKVNEIDAWLRKHALAVRSAG